MESLNIASLYQLPVVFFLEDNDLAIHTRKFSRSAVRDYTTLASAFNLKTFDSSYKDPKNLAETVASAYEFCRTNRAPCFIRVECYRWVEHVGVADDWHLGYREESEANSWKSKDIILNPEIIGHSTSFVESKMDFYYDFFLNLFDELSSYPDPTAEDLLSNVY